MIIKLLIFCFISIQIQAQHTEKVYYKANGQIIDNQENASLYVDLKKTRKGYVCDEYIKTENGWQKGLHEVLKLKNDSIVKIRRYLYGDLTETIIRVFRETSDSLFLIKDYKNEILVSTGQSKNFYPLIKHGTFKNYFDNGQIKSIEQFENNKLLSNERWKENDKTDISNVFEYSDVLPNYKGSIEEYRKYISQNLRYPQDAKRQGIQGVVYVQFVVMENGELNGINLLRGINKALDVEAIRVVTDTPESWNPGLIDNKPVRVHIVLPVIFKLR